MLEALDLAASQDLQLDHSHAQQYEAAHRSLLGCSHHGSAWASEIWLAAPRLQLESGMSWPSPEGSLNKVSLLGRVVALNRRDVDCSVSYHPCARSMHCGAVAVVSVGWSHQEVGEDSPLPWARP